MLFRKKQISSPCWFNNNNCQREITIF